MIPIKVQGKYLLVIKLDQNKFLASLATLYMIKHDIIYVTLFSRKVIV